MSIQTTSKYHLTEDQQRLFNRGAWIAIGIAIGWLLFSDKEGYATNIATEFFGIVVTYLVIEFWIRQQEERRENERQHQKLLLQQIRSPENAVARDAIRQLHEYGLLTGGNNLIQGASLRYANLQNVDLYGANMQEVDLEYANLEDAHLSYSNLQKANLRYANLQRTRLQNANLEGVKLAHANLQKSYLERANLRGADMMGANLQEAYLWMANLQGVNLIGADLQEGRLERADLQGAILAGANLQGVVLRDANLQGVVLDVNEFDETTVLPDAVHIGFDDNNNPIYTPDSYYKPGVTDMRKYTDPNHPDFWQPEWVKQAKQP